MKQFPQLSSLSVIQRQKDQLENFFVAKLNTMVYMMIFFAAVIFLGSILNSSLIAISERKREIATFRVLGYYPTEVGKIFLRETLLINLIGTIIGLPLGYFFNYASLLMFRNDMYSIPCYVYFSTYILTVVLALIFIFCAYFIIQLTINRLNWPNTLSMKE